MTTSVTYTFSNATTADATQVNQNFTDVLAGLNGVDKLTTRGDLLTRNATVYSRLAVGAAGKSFLTDGTDPTWGWDPVIIAKSADYTVTDTDGVESIWMTTAASNRTVTLPTAADNTNRRIIITKADSGAGTCIIDGEGAETVNGATTVTLYLQYQSVTVHCNGTSWLLYSGSYPNARTVVCDITGVASPVGIMGQYQEIIGSSQSSTHGTYIGASGEALSLTPGIYDTQATASWTSVAGTSFELLEVFVGTATGNASTGRSYGKNVTTINLPVLTVTAGNINTLSSPLWRVNVTATTTYYAKSYNNISISTPTVILALTARRAT